MKVAVVGAGGFIGRRFCTALRDRRVEVIAFSSQQHDCFDGDSGMLADLDPVGGLDALVYLAQSPHYRELPLRAPHVWSVNVVSALKAATWARQSGARRILYASTGNVYEPGFGAHRESDPLRCDDWYALSKIHGEQALRLAGEMDLTCLRLFGVYGPGQDGKLMPSLISQVRSRSAVRLQPHPIDASDAGGLRLSVCYVDDVVRVLTRLIEDRGPRVVNIASPEVLNVREIASAVGRHLCVTPNFEIESVPRAFDLIADTTLVSTLVDRFTTFEAGLALTMAHD